MNLTELQKRIRSHTKEKWEAPTEGSDEWNWYRDLLNQSQTEWETTYLWPQLYKEVNTFNGGATLSLPNDFRRFNGPLTVAVDGSNHQYLHIQPDDVVGDPSNGYSAVVNPGTLVSTSSINYSYYASANSLVSGNDITMCPEPNFLVERSLSMYWRARDDSRATLADQKADVILARMLEFEQTEGRPYDQRVKTYEETRSSFVIGRD
jgi:hypothetical protein